MSRPINRGVSSCPPGETVCHEGGHDRGDRPEVVVDDLMQKNYVYTLSEPVGMNFHPEFKPELTPKEMLELGVFGGK